MDLQQIRQQYPQYDDMSDEALARALHSKFYPDMEFSDFAGRIGYNAGPAPIWQGPNNGRVYRLEDGSLQYVDANMSTKDPAKIDEIMQGAGAGDVSRMGMQEDIVAQNPIGARATSFVTGVPFVGEYVDELAGAVAGPEARQGVRMMDAAMEEARPLQDAALGLGGAAAGIAATAPALPMGAAGRFVGGAGSRVGQALRAGALGAGGGAVEGAVSGAGRYDEGRSSGAVMGGAIGGTIGGALGAASPLVAEGLASLVNKFKFAPFRSVARDLGVSEPAARATAGFLDFDEAAPGMVARGGMIGDIGGATGSLLDTAMQTPGGMKVARGRINKRVNEAGAAVRKALDEGLGPARGKIAVEQAIRMDAKPILNDLYEKAYNTPIDYASKAGRKLEALIPRIPGQAASFANRMMRMKGVKSRQILFDVDDEGFITGFRRLPDVMQWDYIKRGLNQMAMTGEGKGALGGQTDIGAVTENLAALVKKNVKKAVPIYGDALESAADAISQVKAVDLGSKLLGRRISREKLQMELAGSTAPERAAMASGLRQFIDDSLAHVKAVASDPDLDGRQARELMLSLSSEDTRKKLELLLGKNGAAPIISELKKGLEALTAKARVAANSRTHGRRMADEAVSALIEPGALGKLKQGEVAGSIKGLVQEFSGVTPAKMSERKQQIYAEISDLLTRSGDKRAQAIVRRLMSAQRQQPITDREAQIIANLVVGALDVGAYQTATRGLEAGQGPR